MNKPHVTVHLQAFEYPSESDATVQIALSESLIRSVMQPLDFPSPDAGLGALFCTNTVTIERVMQSREAAAKLISQALTKALLDAMGARDTQMGYPKRTNEHSNVGTGSQYAKD
jgi:hypothetical protein